MELPKYEFIAPVERRGHERECVSLEAIVKFPGAPGIPCTIQNISPNGALITFANPTILPNTLTLIIPEKWFQSECVVRHRSAHHLGVTFVTNLREALARLS